MRTADRISSEISTIIQAAFFAGVVIVTFGAAVLYGIYKLFAILIG